MSGQEQILWLKTKSVMKKQGKKTIYRYRKK